MIIDCYAPDFNAGRNKWRVFLDGNEVHMVFYVDTELGLLKTYSVLGDKQILDTDRLSPELAEQGKREGWNMPASGAVSKVMRGAIELRKMEKEEAEPHGTGAHPGIGERSADRRE